MKRIAVLAAAVLTSLTLVASSLAHTTRRHRNAVDSSVHRDQVVQWNEEMLLLLQVPGAQPATIHPTRTMAITQLSVYDAVNAIERGALTFGKPVLVTSNGFNVAAAWSDISLAQGKPADPVYDPRFAFLHTGAARTNEAALDANHRSSRAVARLAPRCWFPSANQAST